MFRSKEMGEAHRQRRIHYMELVAILLSMSLISPVVLAILRTDLVIKSSGQIQYLSPLKVDGRFIKDSFNRTITLKGVWKAEYADSCVGWWGDDAYNWNEANVRANMQTLREVWKVNVINTFIWGNWWRDDLAVTLAGYTTSHHYRFSIKEALRIAQEYGLYLQLRLWSPESSEGRVDAPYAPYSSWSLADFVSFWTSVANELKNYPNAIFTLYDEPQGDLVTWFNAAEQAITAIRNTGADNLIVVHYGYCGSCLWMEQWINEERPLHNIVFSNHIYRFHGTFDYNPSSPTDVNYIRTQLADSNGTHCAYKYITEVYNVPIWISAIGSNRGWLDDSEYDYLKNTLAVLNEWGLGYASYQWFRQDTSWTIGYRTPNRVGQALIDAIDASEA